jgi:hypothetical protein
VISAKKEKILRELDLESKEQAYRLQRLFAAVDIVPKEQVVGIGGETSISDGGWGGGGREG